MTKNMGSADRIIRTLAAIAIAALFFTNMISSTLAFILGLLAVVLVATGLMGSCPLYKVLKISTLKKSN